MHERELIADAVDTLRVLVGDESVETVEIVLAPGIDRTNAVEAWSDLTVGTSLADTHVIWEEGNDLLRCDGCGHEYRGDRLDSCPCCGGDGVVIESIPPVAVAHWELGCTAMAPAGTQI
jgi:Zn finger protein HypA/HybF involved in hydrogenase expression